LAIKRGAKDRGSTVVYQHGSSHISGVLKGIATGSNVTGSYPDRKWFHRMSHDQNWKSHDRNYVLRMRNRFPRFFLTIVVVQNVLLRMTDMATGSDVNDGHMTPKEFPCKGARMRSQKLRNIRPSGAFSPEVTSSNLTRPLRSSLGNVVCAHA
jgi:hypothetical protein